MEWLAEHQTLILALVIAAYAVAQIIVKLTPTKKDDEFLAKLVPIGLLLQKVDWAKVLVMLSALQQVEDKPASEEEPEQGDATKPPDM
jgi:hypothetical protein